MKIAPVIALLLLSPWGRPAMSGSPDPAQVLFVADGDTVKVLFRGVPEWVRLLRIDTPEREERGYEAARAELSRLVEGREVRLVFERPGVVERDTHGRILAYLLADGRNVNVEMVRTGWSPFWTRYGKGRFSESFQGAEKEARDGGKGLWGKGAAEER